MKTLKVRLFSYKRTVSTLVLINILMIGSVFLFSKYLPPEVPLFFGRPSGAEQLVQSLYLVIPPTLVLALFALSTGVSQLLADNFIDSMILGILTVTTLLSTLALINIYHLVAVIPFL